MFASEIDKINAPHENAHWNWDDETAHAVWNYSANIYGSHDFRMTLPQWFSMVMGYDRNIEPFVEPK